jgi:nicotinate-nucleotide adenylyltransferase
VVIPNGYGEKKRVGILGGTFDPVHNGHLAIAREARAELELEEVIFVPAGRPWMKAGQDIAPAADRVEMVRLAIAGQDWCRLSTIEIDRPGPTYTVDTLEALRVEYGGDAELYFIMGWDSLPGLPRWKEPLRIIRLCTLVALPRPGSPRPDIIALERAIPGLLGRLIILERPEVDVSATEIRERIAAGLPVSDLVPEAVAEYIGEKGLYR